MRLEKLLELVGAARPARELEGAVAGLVDRVEVGALLVQQLHQLDRARLGRLDLVVMVVQRGEAQDSKAGQRRDERAHQHADLGFLDQQRVARKGERADEQAHREADAAEQ